MGIPLKRLESLAFRELALILSGDVKNKQLANVTITELRITNDLSYMNIYYTCLVDSKREEAEKALEDSKGYLRTELAKKINARKMPSLVFKYDDALAYGNKINSILSGLNIEKDKEEK